MGKYRKSELLELISNMYLNSGDSRESRVFPEAHDILMVSEHSIDEIIEELQEWRDRYDKYSGGATSDRLVEDSIRADIDKLYAKGKKFMRDGDSLKAMAFFDKADAIYWKIGEELLKQSEARFIRTFESGDPLPLLSPDYSTENDLW